MNIVAGSRKITAIGAIYRRRLIEFSFSLNIDCKLGFSIGGQEHIHNNQNEGKLEHD